MARVYNSKRAKRGRKKKQKNGFKKILLLLLVVSGIFVFFKMNTQDTFKEQVVQGASTEVNELVEMEKTEINYVEEDNIISISPKEFNPNKGIVLIADQSVEAKAYIPISIDLAKKGYLVKVVPSNKIDKVISIIDGSKLTRWALGGHGQGGVAASTIAKGSEKIKGMFFLASYPQGEVNLKESGLKIVSLHGSLDDVVGKNKIEESKQSLPDNTLYVNIENGNYSYFANYGPDDTRENVLTREDQQVQAVVQIVNLMDELR